MSVSWGASLRLVPAPTAFRVCSPRRAMPRSVSSATSATLLLRLIVGGGSEVMLLCSALPRCSLMSGDYSHANPSMRSCSELIPWSLSSSNTSSLDISWGYPMVASIQYPC